MQSSSFWSSVVLTGDQTAFARCGTAHPFWSSVVLTGDQTTSRNREHPIAFWSSVVLTGDQTVPGIFCESPGFGAVSF